MRDHHTSQHLHANLLGTDTKDYHLELPLLEICLKNDKIFKDLPNVFGIVDNILVVGYDSDGKDHDKMFKR